MLFRNRKTRSTWRELLGDYYSVPLDVAGTAVDIVLGRGETREPKLYPEKILRDSRVLELLDSEDVVSTIRMFEKPLSSRVAWRLLYNAYIGRDKEKIKSIIEVLSSRSILEYLDGVREEELGFNPIVYLFSIAAGTRSSSYVVKIARYFEECGEDAAVEFSNLSDVLVYSVGLSSSELERVLDYLASYDCSSSPEVARRLSQLLVFRELREPELVSRVVEQVGRLSGEEAVEVVYNAIEVLSRLEEERGRVAREYFDSITQYSRGVARELSSLLATIAISAGVEGVEKLLRVLRGESIRRTIDSYGELAPAVLRGINYAYVELGGENLPTRFERDLESLWRSRDKVLEVVERYKSMSRDVVDEIVCVLSKILLSLGRAKFEELVDILLKEDTVSLVEALGDKRSEELQDLVRRVGQLLYLAGGDIAAIYNVLRAIGRVEARDLHQLALSLVTISTILRDAGAAPTLVSNYVQKIALLLPRYKGDKLDEVLEWLTNIAIIMRDSRAPPENFGLILRALESVGVKLVDIVKPEEIVEKALTAKTLREFTSSLEKLYLGS